MIKMVAWDMDSTICDSMSMCVEAFRRAVEPFAGRTLSEEEIVGRFGINEIGMIKAVVEPEDYDAAITAFYHNYSELHTQCSEPFPGIRDILNYLKTKPVKVVLVTGKGAHGCEITLAKLGLDGYFDDIMPGAEDHINKAESIPALLEKYQITPEEFLYIGDAVSDFEACCKAGVVCLSAAWADCVDVKMLLQLNPGRVFKRVADLEAYLKGLLGD